MTVFYLLTTFDGMLPVLETTCTINCRRAPLQQRRTALNGKSRRTRSYCFFYCSREINSRKLDEQWVTWPEHYVRNKQMMDPEHTWYVLNTWTSLSRNHSQTSSLELKKNGWHQTVPYQSNKLSIFFTMWSLALAKIDAMRCLVGMKKLTCKTICRLRLHIASTQDSQLRLHLLKLNQQKGRTCGLIYSPQLSEKSKKSFF